MYKLTCVQIDLCTNWLMLLGQFVHNFMNLHLWYNLGGTVGNNWLRSYKITPGPHPYRTYLIKVPSPPSNIPALFFNIAYLWHSNPHQSAPFPLPRHTPRVRTTNSLSLLSCPSFAGQLLGLIFSFHPSVRSFNKFIKKNLISTNENDGLYWRANDLIKRTLKIWVW